MCLAPSPCLTETHYIQHQDHQLNCCVTENLPLLTNSGSNRFGCCMAISSTPNALSPSASSFKIGILGSIIALIQIDLEMHTCEYYCMNPVLGCGLSLTLLYSNWLKLQLSIC